MTTEITGFRAFVQVTKEGDEGLVAYKSLEDDTWYPMIISDGLEGAEDRFALLHRRAVHMSRQLGGVIRVVRFTNREVLEELRGN